MGKQPLDPEAQSDDEPRVEASESESWSRKYGEKHRLHRIAELPLGIIPPRQVRIYRRCAHYVLQWWDPAAKTNLSDRVEGDLVTAIAQARQIEERLNSNCDSGLGCRRLRHAKLVEAFLADLTRRADAGQIRPGTVNRYASALEHYLAFAEQPAIARITPYAASVGREFQMAYSAFLANRSVAPNGCRGAQVRPMRGQNFVEDATRAMFAWAADPDRGHLLPAGFRNPFLNRARQRKSPVVDPLGEPDITMAMAEDFLEACDAYQLVLFTPLIFFGLRASEPCYLFGEHLEDGWLRIPCIPDLDYETKGRRDKRFPLIGELATLYRASPIVDRPGLLFLRRGIDEGRERPPLLGATLPRLVEEYRRRCVSLRQADARRKHRLRNDVLRDAGGIRYDDLQGEFSRLARRLNWPDAATLKDFRHLFCTGLENAGVPEYYRRYLMGHAPGGAAITHYTHLNKLREQYETAMRREWPRLLAIVEKRAGELGLLSATG